jgi:hypothetical protein
VQGVSFGCLKGLKYLLGAAAAERRLGEIENIPGGQDTSWVHDLPSISTTFINVDPLAVDCSILGRFEGCASSNLSVMLLSFRNKRCKYISYVIYNYSICKLLDLTRLSAILCVGAP